MIDRLFGGRRAALCVIQSGQVGGRDDQMRDQRLRMTTFIVQQTFTKM